MPRLAALMLSALLLGCTHEGGSSAQPDDSRAPIPPGSGGGGSGQVLAYDVHVAPDLSTLEVELCFAQAPGGRLVPASRRARDYIERIRQGRNPIPRIGGTYSLDRIAGGDCIDYAVHLSAMAQAEGTSQYIRQAGDSVVVRQSMWLWRPDEVPKDTRVQISLNLPDGVDASVPWSAAEGQARTDRHCTYDADLTVFHWLGYTAFGSLDVQRFSAHGTEVEVAALDAPLDASAQGLRAWATDAVASTAQLFGNYPREHIQLVVLPIDGGGSGPAYFGMAGRGGGAGVYVLLDAHADDESLPGGWTTTHELLHHGMPFIDDPWMGEGWVSYYTELQRTRRGLRDETAGWQKLLEAFDRGRRTRRPASLQSLSDHMHETFAYQRVYWGGAAVALAIDVALREDSGGERSLDDAMRFLRDCCGDATHKWSAQTLLEKLDTWYGKPLFTSTAAPLLQGEGFPRVEDSLAKLGVRVEDGRVRLDDQHPMAAQRRAIMAPRKD